MSDSKIKRMREILSELESIRAKREELDREGGAYYWNSGEDDLLREFAKLTVELGDAVPVELTFDAVFPLSDRARKILAELDEERAAKGR